MVDWVELGVELLGAEDEGHIERDRAHVLGWVRAAGELERRGELVDEAGRAKLSRRVYQDLENNLGRPNPDVELVAFFASGSVLEARGSFLARGQ